ncbi:MAG TPA: TylF/MycF/NovP-related O-methyltransferase [Dongiaceae bacterium]|jgi:asparagine synthase (glutamine-hydrolysing)|nr:TylF/MycF/NovP-related O-methyltransferase [Dongiaceae bacterium]
MALLPRDVRAVMRERLTYLSPKKLVRLTGAVRDVARRNVPGDILEFGIALGGSSVLLAKHASRTRQFHGFDVFGMIPPPTSAKDDMKSKERYEAIASGKSRGIGGDMYYGYRSDLFESVCATFARYGNPVGNGSAFLHKGLFEETWPSYERAAVAFAHIDCDWYDPVRFCLNAIRPRLAPGGVIILDDYHDYGGCRAATDEFLSEHRDSFSVDDGANLILRRALH